MSEEQLSRLRRHQIGFIFQFFHLVPRLTAAANVELPMVFAGIPPAERGERVRQALEVVGLSPRAKHRPDQLSGGEQQRVAIARAVVMSRLSCWRTSPPAIWTAGRVARSSV